MRTDRCGLSSFRKKSFKSVSILMVIRSIEAGRDLTIVVRLQVQVYIKIQGIVFKSVGRNEPPPPPTLHLLRGRLCNSAT